MREMVEGKGLGVDFLWEMLQSGTCRSGSRVLEKEYGEEEDSIK